MAARLVIVDMMVFAGVDPGDADSAVREGTAELEAAAPPAARRMPFRSLRLPWDR